MFVVESGRFDGRAGFVEDALIAGLAYDSNGQAQASMGVVAEDLNADGAIDLFLSHVKDEYHTLYLNNGEGLFSDTSRAT